MKFNSRKLIIALTVLLLSCSAAFAQSVQESNSVKNYNEIDFETASLKDIILSYDASVSEYNTKAQNLYDHMLRAYNEGNASDYFDAKHMLANLAAPSITKEQTEILAKRTAEEKDSELQAEFAQWLYSKSRYYRPSITFTSQRSSDNYSSSYRYSVSVFPGSKVTVPTVKLGSKTTELVGWGLSEDEVLYKTGDEITMPYDSITLHAIFQEVPAAE